MPKTASTVRTASILCSLLAVSMAYAQEPPKIVEKKDVRIEINELQGETEPLQAHTTFITSDKAPTFDFVAGEVSIENKLVKGRPYSAEAVTRSIHTLADGNRIVRSSVASIYRDGEGRTRREETVGGTGPWGAAAGERRTIFINDPVAGLQFTLDPANLTARKMTVRTSGEGSDLAVKSRIQMRSTATVKEKVHTAHATWTPKIASLETRTESLGMQTIEGVQAEGTRTISTIPAGQIGNERPIEIVSERWYSPELDTVVMTLHNDPRTGETSYSLRNIFRGEPSPSLFSVPSEYKINETGVYEFRFETKTKSKPDDK